MKAPTLEDIANEHKIYREYLDRGGQPIRFLLELVPKKGDTLDWHLIPSVPDDLPRDLTCLAMFCGWIKERIMEAIRPPTMEEMKSEGPKRN